MPIVKYKNQSGVTYAYEQTSSYDPDRKQSRPIRKYLGRVDPETGEIIPTAGKRGRPPKAAGESKSDNSSSVYGPFSLNIVPLPPRPASGGGSPAGCV